MIYNYMEIHGLKTTTEYNALKEKWTKDKSNAHQLFLGNNVDNNNRYSSSIPIFYEIMNRLQNGDYLRCPFLSGLTIGSVVDNIETTNTCVMVCLMKFMRGVMIDYFRPGRNNYLQLGNYMFFIPSTFTGKFDIHEFDKKIMLDNMSEIYQTCNPNTLVGIVDIRDWGEVSKRTWYCDIRTTKKGNNITMRARDGKKKLILHNLIKKLHMTELTGNYQHANGVGFDCRLNNLNKIKFEGRVNRDTGRYGLYEESHRFLIYRKYPYGNQNMVIRIYLEFGNDKEKVRIHANSILDYLDLAQMSENSIQLIYSWGTSNKCLSFE